MRVHATGADMQGKLMVHNWESSSAEDLQTVRLVERQSLADHWQNPTISMCIGKRRIIERAALRVVAADAGRNGVDERSPECCVQIRSVGMSCTVCLPVSKTMHASPVGGMLSRAHMSVKPTHVSALAKMKEHKAHVPGVLRTPTAEFAEPHDLV